MTEKERARLVRRAWARLSGVDPDELEAAVERRAEEIKLEMDVAIYGTSFVKDGRRVDPREVS